MKKHLIFVAFATLLVTCLCSCKKEKEDNKPIDNTPVTARFVFGGSVGEKLQGIYQVTATYSLVSDGETRTNTDLAVGDSIVLDDIACPCTMAVRLQYTPCGTIDTTATYSFHNETFIKAHAYNYYENSPKCDHGDVPGSHLQDIIDLVNSTLRTYNISIDAEGYVTVD